MAYSSVARCLINEENLMIVRPLAYIGVFEDASIQDHIIYPINGLDCGDFRCQFLMRIKIKSIHIVRSPLWPTVILSSDETSHSRSVQLALGAAPASAHSCEALDMSLTVAKTWSPLSIICLTHSRPMPLEAPMTTHNIRWLDEAVNIVWCRNQTKFSSAALGSDTRAHVAAR